MSWEVSVMVFQRKRVTFFFRLIVGLSALFLCACDNSGTTGDTGSISFNLEWKSGVSDESNLVLTANGDVCENYQISTISATVYDATDKNIASKNFACTDHSGSFAGIPAGSGYRLVIKGMVSGNPDWTGQKGGLAVTDGQTTNAGTISMTYSGSDETPPEVLLVSPGISVANVAVNTTVTALFNEAMNGSSFKTTSFILENASDNSVVAGSVGYNSVSKIATFSPEASLAPNIEYRATLTAVITDIAGNPLPGGGYSWSFITGDLTCAYSIDPATQTINPAGGSGEITVTASNNACAWTAVSAEPWITITSGDSGTGSGTVQFTVSENTGASPRTGAITVAGETFTVQQGLGDCTFTISPTGQTIAFTGGSGSVSVTASRSDCAWTASASAAWISITSGSSGTGSGSVDFSVAENTTTSPRTGTITVAGTPFTVEQGENAGLPKMVWDASNWDEVNWQ